MAGTYRTDFSDQAPGPIVGWTERWDTAGSWQVVAGAGFGGSQGLQYAPGTAARHALSWDVLDADPDRGDIEFLYRWASSVGGASATNDLRVFARGSGVDATTQANGYSIGPTNTVLRFVKYVTGTSTTTDAAGGAVTANAWYWSRVRVNGSTIQQKMWPDGTTEPTTWAQTVTDTQVTGPGWAGVFLSVLAATRMTYDQIIAVTGGGTATAAAPAVTVSAGSDVTAPAGQAVTITGTATSSGTIATRAWTERWDTAGSWQVVVGAATVHAALADESDTSWVEAVNPAGASILVDLAPSPVGAKTVNYRVQLDPATPGSGTWLVEYLSAGVTRASKNVTATTSGIVAGTLVLTDAENAAVTDPNNQQLRFTATSA
jgi:hypothetical protein